MKNFKYFIEFLFIIFLFLIFRLIGLKFSRIFSAKLFSILGPFFRSKEIIFNNISIAYPDSDKNYKKLISKKMWENYGKIFSEYMFIKNFRKSNSENLLEISGQKILNQIKLSKKPVVFISGHFDNFELMAMHIEKSGIDLAAIYRPLNNIFLNPLMEKIRKTHICKKQIKKGISGTKQILKNFKDGTSIALMIDQRVSEGIKSKFFGKDAFTTTIPAQFVKKFGTRIVPIYIERKIDESFNLIVYEPIKYQKEDSIETITSNLNEILEKMIIRNPEQWIWTHNRWK